jgi:hypothetical protein
MAPPLEYRVIALNDPPSSQEVYDAAMKVYRESFDYSVATNEAEIAYWSSNYNSEYNSTGDRVYFYALVRQNLVCGFAMTSYVKSSRILIVEYLAVSEGERNMSSLHHFFHGIEQHLANNALVTDFVVVEHLIYQKQDDHYNYSMRLLNLYVYFGFSIVDMDYVTPNFLNDVDQGSSPAYLLILPVRRNLGSRRQNYDLNSSKIQEIVICVFNWYERWYRPFLTPAGFESYRARCQKHARYNLRQLKRREFVRLYTPDDPPPARGVRFGNVLRGGGVLAILLTVASIIASVILEVSPDQAAQNVAEWVGPEVAACERALDVVVVAVVNIPHEIEEITYRSSVQKP